MCSRTCSSCAVFRAIFGPITAPSSWPKRCVSGSRLWEPRRLTSSRAARGRTVTHESFNSKLRDELLKGEIFYTLKEAQIVIESWRRHYNTARPHSSLGYKPPAPEVLLWPAAKPQPAP